MKSTGPETLPGVMLVLLAFGVLLLGTIPGCGEKTAQDHFDAGAAKFQDGDVAGAIEAYKKGLALEPTSAVGHNLLGLAYRQQWNTLRTGDWKDKEIAAFRLAVAADSTYWPACINLGASLYYLGERSEAVSYLTRALLLNPQNPARADLEDLIREAGGEIPVAGSSD